MMLNLFSNYGLVLPCYSTAVWDRMPARISESPATLQMLLESLTRGELLVLMLTTASRFPLTDSDFWGGCFGDV